MKSAPFKPKGTTVAQKLCLVGRICIYREFSTCIHKGYPLVIWFSFSWCFLASSSVNLRSKLSLQTSWQRKPEVTFGLHVDRCEPMSRLARTN